MAPDPEQGDRIASGASAVPSLHIDTGRGWRSGQQQVLYTVIGLRAIGHRAVLVAHPDGELGRRMSDGDDLIPLAPKADVDLDAAWRLSRVVRALRPAVVHAHDPHAVAMAATALSIAEPRPRPALLASRRTDTHLDHNSFSRWKYSQVTGFIANCRVIRDHLVASGIPPERTAIVGDGVDVARIARVPAANVHATCFLPTHAPVVGTFCSLAPQKGLHHLVDAAALAVRDVPDARFVIVGDGEMRGALEQHVRHAHLERHVFLTGFRAEALELLKGCDLVAVSSIGGGMSLALLDAMASSKAAVATAAGGNPDALVDGETGFLVPPRDHVAMAEKLVVLLKDPHLRVRMGAAALARIRAHFTVERMVADTAAAYARFSAGGAPN